LPGRCSEVLLLLALAGCGKGHDIDVAVTVPQEVYRALGREAYGSAVVIEIVDGWFVDEEVRSVRLAGYLCFDDRDATFEHSLEREGCSATSEVAAWIVPPGDFGDATEESLCASSPEGWETPPEGAPYVSGLAWPELEGGWSCAAEPGTRVHLELAVPE